MDKEEKLEILQTLVLVTSREFTEDAKESLRATLKNALNLLQALAIPDS